VQPDVDRALAGFGAGGRRDSRVVAEIRAAMAPERFDAAFAAGSHFDRHAAVAAARDGRAPERRQTRRAAHARP
jgi:hypothetical protein